jgi:polyisoprenyl-phosphate glycosyltransferase
VIVEKENKFVSAVAYLYRDEEQVEKFIRILYPVLNDHFAQYEIIFANDGCSAGSMARIKDFVLKNKVPAVSFVHMGFHQGIELAMNAGVDLAVGDFVYEFDSLAVDYNQQLIIDIYQNALQGFDVVSAVPRGRVSFSSRLFYAAFNRFSNSCGSLSTERFRILSRRAINRVGAFSKTISYRKAAYASSGLNIKALTYEPIISERVSNSDTFRLRKETAFDSLVIFTDFAYKVSLTLTIMLLSLTISGIIYTLVQYFGIHKPLEGWTTLMLMVSGGLSGVFMILAFILKYLSVIIELVLKKQKYLVQAVEKIT